MNPTLVTFALGMLVVLAVDIDSRVRDLKPELPSPAEVRSDGLILLTTCDGSRVALALNTVAVVMNADGCLRVVAR